MECTKEPVAYRYSVNRLKDLLVSYRSALLWGTIGSLQERISRSEDISKAELAILDYVNDLVTELTAKHTDELHELTREQREWHGG